MQELSSYVASLCCNNSAVVSGAPRTLPTALAAREVAFFSVELSNVLEHGVQDMVIQVQGGMPVVQLQQYLKRHGQWLPVSAADKSVTVAELIATNHAGCLEHGTGGLRDLCLGVTSILPSGEIINSGGSVVKNVSGYDLRKLFIGSRDSLGIVAAANLRLSALPENRTTVVWKFSDLSRVYSCALKLIGSDFRIAALEIFSPEILNQKTRLLASLPGASSLTLAAQSQIFSDTGYVLAIEVVGRKQIVDDTINSINRAINEEATKLNDVLAEDLWRLLADLPLAVSCLLYLEIILPAGRHPGLLASFGKQDNLGWQSRPSSGRLKMFVPDIDGLSRVYHSLQQYQSTTNEQLVVASADSNYEYCIHYYPPISARLASIKDQIKQKFDPHGCLNPQVKV